MKKIGCLLVLLIFISGCSVQRVQYTSYIDTIYQVLEENITLHNVSLEGYYYYLPKGASLLEKSETNSIILYQGTKFYLYVDVVSYFHRTDNTFDIQEDSYYAKEINYDDKYGYLKITKFNGYYFVEYMYHYAKIEAYVEEEKIHDAIYQMSVILSSVHYHDKILESLIGSNVINYKEENFEILAPKDSVSSSEGYLDYDYDQTYEGYDGEIKDEDSIEILEDGER